jgi:isopenicillin N synthase-like dioxygenase
VNLARIVLRCLSTALGLKQHQMEGYFEKPLAIQRLLRYPMQNLSAPETLGVSEKDFVLLFFDFHLLFFCSKAGAHVDYGALTILKQGIFSPLNALLMCVVLCSDSDGLEVFVRGEWRIITCPADCVIVQTGFMLEKLTGGALRATQHRVINRNNHHRFSTALFFDPDPSSQIAPLLPVVEGKDYKPCVAGHKGVRYVTPGFESNPD